MTSEQKTRPRRIRRLVATPLAVPIAVTLALTLLIAACSDEIATPVPTPELTADRFTDVTGSNLPVKQLEGRCMDATNGDLDADGDLDLILAQENATNLVLLNDGDAGFTIGSLNGGDGDNEDVRLADLDGDGDLDLVTVHEDDQVHSILENDGAGGFSAIDGRLPEDLRTTANALELRDLNGDGSVDLLIGNAGTNVVLVQQSDGSFIDETSVRPIGAEVTQDLLLLDVDGDGDEDLFVVNEDQNLLLINRGDGTFADETADRLPSGSSESREAAAADIDGDGDVDIVVANVAFNRDVAPDNQLLRNDGRGVFSDMTAEGLAAVENSASSFTVQFVDIDSDGDVDILSPANDLGDGGNIEVWVNKGNGLFQPAASSPFTSDPSGSTFDIEVADFNGDGQDDLYFCNRTGTDQLYLGG